MFLALLLSKRLCRAKIAVYPSLSVMNVETMDGLRVKVKVNLSHGETVQAARVHFPCKDVSLCEGRELVIAKTL